MNNQTNEVDEKNTFEAAGVSLSSSVESNTIIKIQTISAELSGIE